MSTSSSAQAALALPVLRVEELEQLQQLGIDSGDDIVPSLYEILCSDSVERLQSMQKGLKDNDLRPIGAAAHSLRSSCAALGGDRTSRLCQEIEMACRRSDKQEAATLYPILEREMAAFLTAVGAFTKRTAKH